MSDQPQGQQPQLDAFIIYKAKDGKRVPVQLTFAASKHQAQKMGEAFGLVAVVPIGEVEDPTDVLRLALPTLVMLTLGMQQMLAVIAADAQQRMDERAKRGFAGLVRGQ